MEEAWRVSQGTLTLMAKDSEAHHAEFWVVTLDLNDQVHPDPQVREASRKEIGAETLHYPDTRLVNFARHEGIHSIMLAPGMADFAEKHHVFLHGFFNTGPNVGHMNKEGHEVAGEIIARQLCAAGSKLARGTT
jgi:hypothetical protein